MTKNKLSIEMKKYKDIRSSDIKDRIKEQLKLLKYLTWSQIGYLIGFGNLKVFYQEF